MNYLKGWELHTQYLLYLFVEYIFGGCAYLLVYHLAAFYEEHTWYAGNAIVDRKIWVLVHVHFTYIYLAFVLLVQGIDSRA